MATKTMIVCDVELSDGTPCPGLGETFTFKVGASQMFDIDLCPSHVDLVSELSLLGKARPHKALVPQRPLRSADTRRATTARNAAIRAWAAAAGIEVSPRGVIPENVMEKYAAHQAVLANAAEDERPSFGVVEGPPDLAEQSNAGVFDLGSAPVEPEEEF